MFVQGSNDPFGSIKEIQTTLRLIPAAHTLTVVEGAGHDLRRGRFDLRACQESTALMCGVDGAIV
jgi:predicted alpha/beta-hydrolase family hydrolase